MAVSAEGSSSSSSSASAVVLVIRTPEFEKGRWDSLVEEARLGEVARIEVGSLYNPESLSKLRSADLLVLLADPERLAIANLVANVARYIGSGREALGLLIVSPSGDPNPRRPLPGGARAVGTLEPYEVRAAVEEMLNEVRVGRRGRAAELVSAIEMSLSEFLGMLGGDRSTSSDDRPTPVNDSPAPPTLEEIEDHAQHAYEAPTGESASAPEEPSLRFEANGFSDFTPSALGIVELARRLGEGRERPETSVRRLVAALMLSGLERSNAKRSCAWLVNRVEGGQRAVFDQLANLYPAIGRHGEASAILRGGGEVAQAMTPNLKGVLDLARRLAREAQASESPPEVGVRHLLGATLRDEAQRTHVQRLYGEFGLKIGELRAALIDALSGWRVPDHPAVWRRLLGPRAEDQYRLPRYESDSAVGRDQLGIMREVEAMASLVAAWAVEPPLSIGLFGEWGSGKTFFMQKVKERVGEIAAKARASGEAQRDFGYYKNIVQVEFNAWHYVEGNLWASLVEHIFRNLRVAEDDGPTEMAIRHEKLVLEMQAEVTRKGAVDAKLGKLTSQAEEASRRAADARAVAERAENQKAAITATDVVESVIVSAEVRGQVAKGLEKLQVRGGPLESVNALRSALTEATEAATVIRAGVRYVASERQWWVVVMWLVAVPVTVWVLAWLAHWLASGSWAGVRQALATSVSAVAGLAGAVAAAWRWTAPKIKPVLDAAKSLKAKRAELDQRIEEARREQKEKVGQLQKEADEKRQQADAAEQEQREARARIEEIRKQIEDLTPGRMIGRFIQDRASAEDYRKHLGVPALIRRDFEKLALMFRSQRKVEEERKDGLDASGRPLAGRNDPSVVNRIVLYIDDLDRCEPSKVVEVLRMIHLLLAFPLFVVVVAVDARWMKRSLKDRYDLMLAGARDGNGNGLAENREASEERRLDAAELALGVTATPDDYLEKIFQIPFWIRPLGRAACESLVRALTAGDLEEVGREAAAEAGAKVARASGADAGDRSRADAGSVATESRGAGNDPGVRADEASGGGEDPGMRVEVRSDAWRPVEANPRALHLSKDEREYMVALAAVIGRSPRAVKRFVNCYRLLKSASEPAAVAHGASTGTFRVTMLLLGLVTGYPEAAARVVRDLREKADAGQEAGAWGREAGERLGIGGNPKWGVLVGLLTELGVTVAALREAVDLVDRFSFSPIRGFVGVG